MRVKLKHRRLAEELARRPLSLNRWAQRIGLSSGHLSDLVNGKRVYVMPRTRERLLAALDLPFEELFEVEFGSSRSPARGRQLDATPYRTPLPRQRRDLEESTMQDLWHQLRLAGRALRRSPAYTLTAILTLTLGIGSNTALFSIVNSILWKPFPFAEPERLVVVYSSNQQRGWSRSNVSYPDYLDLRAGAAELLDLAAWDWEPYALDGGGEPIRIGGGRVSAGFFDVLGVRPLLGRGFLPEQERVGGGDAVVLSEGLWRSYFGADPGITGREVLINSRAHAVVGVMPAAAMLPEDAHLWVPLQLDEELAPRTSNWLGALGRLRPGADLDQARARLALLGEQLEAQYPEANEGRGFGTVELREDLVDEAGTISLTLLGVVAFVLLIACANVTHLLLSRGIARQRELAVRRALGADRYHLTRELLAESALLAAGGAILGFAAGWVALRSMVAAIGEQLPAWVSTEVDWRVVGATALAAVAALLVFSLVPIVQAGRAEVGEGLLGRAGHADARRHRRLRGALVAAEVALSLSLLFGAALMIKSLLGLRSVDPGFATQGRLSVGLDLLAHIEEPLEQRLARVQSFFQQVRALPGVEAVGITTMMPLRGRTARYSLVLEGQAEADYTDNPSPVTASVSGGYFDAMGIPLLRGRTFDEQWSAQGSETAIVSQRLAERLWPGRDPLGQRLRLAGEDPEAVWYTVAGVAGDIHHAGLDQEADTSLYLPYQRFGTVRTTLVLATGGRDPEALVPAVREAIHRADPHQPIHEVMTLQALVEESYWHWRFFGVLFWAFAALALLLACVGIYGVMSYAVVQRVREVGIRMALGALPEQMIGLVLREGMALISIGLVLGLPLALGLAGVLASTLYGIQGFEPRVLLLVALSLGLVGVAAAFLPARRAARVDPARTLRSE